MMTRLATGGYRRRGAAGVAFVYFSLLALPVLFFGAGLATDFTRIIIASRQVSNAAQASALAGAQQFEPNEARLDRVAAVAMARETYCYAQSAGQMSLSSPTGSTVGCSPLAGSISLDVTPVSSGLTPLGEMYTQVDVTARYEVRGLLFAKLFGADSTFVAVPITRSAGICRGDDPGGPTGGHCVHPNRN